MSNEKEKWIDDAFDSLKGMKRAEPESSLFAKIEEEVYGAKVKELSPLQWRLMAASAAIVLLLNLSALWYASSNPLASSIEQSSAYSNQALISDFKIYE